MRNWKRYCDNLAKLHSEPMKQNTEQLKKEFEELIDTLFDKYGEDYEVYNPKALIAEVWNFFAPHLINSDEIKREAVEDFARWLLPEGQGSLHISSPRGVKALLSKYRYEKGQISSEENNMEVVLGVFLDAYHNAYDYCYIGYRSFEDTGLTKKQIKPIIKKLLDDGIVDFQKGLFNEDGEVAGSGWGITDIKKAETYLTQSKEGGE